MVITTVLTILSTNPETIAENGPKWLAAAQRMASDIAPSNLLPVALAALFILSGVLLVISIPPGFSLWRRAAAYGPAVVTPSRSVRRSN